MYIVHQHIHQNQAIMKDCSQGKCLLFDFLDLLTGVYLLGHRSLVSGQALEHHRVFSCVTITALVPPPTTLDCSIDLRCYEINKSNEA